METSQQKEFLIKLAFFISVAVLVYTALRLLSGPLLPFAFAALITVLLQKFAKKFAAKFKIKKKAASVLAVLSVYVLAGCLLTWVGYALYRQLMELVSALPQYTERIARVVESISGKIQGFIGRLPDSAESLVGKLPSATVDSVASGLADYVAELARNVASGVPYVLLSVVVMIVSSAYFAKDYDEICGFVVKKLPKRVTDSLVFVKNELLHSLSRMLKGYAVIMLITFLELFIGLTVIGSEYALIIAAVTAAVDILPVFGSGTVLVPWALFSALFGNLKKAIGILVIYIMVTAVRNFIEPKIIGSKLGVHPLVMLASVFLGLKFFGAAGILIFPLAVIVSKHLLERRNGESVKTDNVAMQKNA